ncbi:MAG: tetratricopeptide repeat protein [Pyrinomonadaceae bacterium]
MKSFFFAYVLFVCLVFAQAGCRSKVAQSNDNAASPVAGETGAQSSTGEGSGDARALVQKGKEAYKNDHDEEAVEAFREAVRLDPGYAEAHYRLGLAYAAIENRDEADKSFEEAVKAYRKIVERDSKNAEAQFFLGLSYNKLHKYEEAVRAFKEAAKIAPDDDDKQYELGLASMKLAQYKEAAAAFNKALEINPDNFPASDALEQAKSGLQRVEDFQRQQEKLRKPQETRPGQTASTNSTTNANGNSNTTQSTNANTAPPPPPPPPQR